jgi:hypothetical protein
MRIRLDESRTSGPAVCSPPGAGPVHRSRTRPKGNLVRTDDRRAAFACPEVFGRDPS